MVIGKQSPQAAVPNKTATRAWSKVAAGATKPSSPSPKPAAQTNDRMAAAVAKLMNKPAEVTLRSGQRYTGTVIRMEASNGLSLTLRDAQLEDGSGKRVAEFNVKPGDLVQVHGPTDRPASASASASASREPGKGGAWKTDTDISARSGIKERQLQAWQPDNQDEGFSLESDSAPAHRGPQSSHSATGGKWDQFAANEQLFGVKSQWDEDVYTHKLDTSRPDFAKRQAEAAKIAREIEGAASTNAHVLEERNQAADDSGVTEEDKYSGVVRQGTANRWVPPAQRAAAQAQNNGQPVDPAIISAQLARPGVTVTSADSPTQASGPGGKDDAIEAKLMRRFQEFVGKEEQRVQQKKAQSFKKEKEKDGRLQDLLKFSQSFKLNTPVPEDLIPILTKDKTKQDAIVQKSVDQSHASPGQQETKSDSLRARIDKMRVTPGGPQAPSPIRERSPAGKSAGHGASASTAAASSTSGSSSTTKLKPTAFAFKPSAASFTPSFAPRGAPGMAGSPALSTASSVPRHPPNHVDPSLFFGGKSLRPASERPKISDLFNPFKTFRAANPESEYEIEQPHRTDPAWPHEADARGLLDPPTYTFGKPYSASGANYDEFVGSPAGAMTIPMHAGGPYGPPFMQPVMGGPGMPPPFMGTPMYMGSPQQAMVAAAAAAAAAGMPFQGGPQGYYGQQGMPMSPQQQHQQGRKHSTHASTNYAGSPQQSAGFYQGGGHGAYGGQQAGSKQGGGPQQAYGLGPGGFPPAGYPGGFVAGGMQGGYPIMAAGGGQQHQGHPQQHQQQQQRFDGRGGGQAKNYNQGAHGPQRTQGGPSGQGQGGQGQAAPQGSQGGGQKETKA